MAVLILQPTTSTPKDVISIRHYLYSSVSISISINTCTRGQNFSIASYWMDSVQPVICNFH